MPRVFVTKELAESIKAMRLENKIASKDVAQYVKKSPAFITKLEKGDILTIDEDELKNIFKFISSNNTSFDDIIEKIYTTLRYKYSQEEINKQVWFDNFDTVKRKLPIPKELIDEITDRMKQHSIEPQYLLQRINSNEGLSESERNDDNISFNMWYSPENKPSIAKSIKIRLDEATFNGILSKEIDVSPYIFLLSIVFYLIKIEIFKDRTELIDDENNDVTIKATSLLNKYKYYSLSAKETLLAEVKSKDERNELLSSFDKENISIVNNILSKIRFISESDIKTTNKNLNLFNDNLEWDMGFIMKLISFNFNSLSNLSYSQKKELLFKIESLIEEYKNIPDDKKRIETY